MPGAHRLSTRPGYRCVHSWSSVITDSTRRAARDGTCTTLSPPAIARPTDTCHEPSPRAWTGPVVMGMNSGGLFARVNDSKVSARERHPGRGGAIHQGVESGVEEDTATRHVRRGRHGASGAR